ncbi:oxidoreductase [Bacillus sp. JJ722]|uniref:oxidoreductase n=1 Tax=Bacillus sp. JJ722 TaxID=3122973 RepID=UPI003000785D
MDTDKRSALIVGATGLVGSNLLEILLRSNTYKTVKVLVRNPTSLHHPKLTEIIVDFNTLDKQEEVFAVDDVFCCLGTTIKKAGSKEAFQKVDYQYPIKIAELAKKRRAKQFLIVSAVGADSHSRFFYNRVKGELELALKKMQLPSLHIFRPSLLLGKRNEFRFGERIGTIISPLFSPLLIGSLSKNKPIQANELALVMYNIAKENKDGEFIYEWNNFQKILKGDHV